MDAPGAAPKARAGTYAVFFLLFAGVLFLSHLPLLSLPYYWDEAGQFIPQALDLLHGAVIPHSVTPSIHPPAVMLYLAAVWKLCGYHPLVTRSAMLLVSSLGVLAAFLLAIELLKNFPGRGALLAAGLLCCSPLFFAQSMLAQLDAPAMVLTAWALLFFLRERISLAAAVCVPLVMTKETGILVPLVFAAWLARERRWRDAAFFLGAPIVLGLWIVALAHSTGSWTGNPEFEQYNLYYPLHPVRLLVNLVRRVYYLGFANFHWIGVFAIAFVWKTSRLFHDRAWRVAWTLLVAHAVLVTVLGGAVLERYLLPILPILYVAMAAGLSLFPRRPRLICSVALIAGLAASNFINPLYPFPYENNLAFSDFVKLHMELAGYLTSSYPGAEVTTVWPLTAELANPKLGYVDRSLAVREISGFTPQELAAIDWKQVQIFVAYSRDWSPGLDLMQVRPIRALWERFYRSPDSLRSEVRDLVRLPLAARIERHGQWIDVYVNATPLIRGGSGLRWPPLGVRQSESAHQ